MKVGDFVVERLHAWGVRRIYGYPGDGINGVIGALQRAGNIEFIQVRHEEMAAFMAVAHAKFTGELGVCLSTGGPGATHLITGLYDGKLDHAPVLAICGQAEATVRGASYQQELNLDRMFADVAGIRAGGFLAGSGATPPGPMREGRKGAITRHRSSSSQRTFRTRSTRSRR